MKGNHKLILLVQLSTDNEIRELRECNHKIILLVEFSIDDNHAG